jgi:hypothetical protein
MVDTFCLSFNSHVFIMPENVYAYIYHFMNIVSLYIFNKIDKMVFNVVFVPLTSIHIYVESFIEMYSQGIILRKIVAAMSAIRPCL